MSRYMARLRATGAIWGQATNVLTTDDGCKFPNDENKIKRRLGNKMWTSHQPGFCYIILRKSCHK